MASRVEVLVAAMHQTDFSLVEKMNITTDAVIANQSDCNNFSVTETQNGIVKMVSTDTRGVGLKRNIALHHSSGDILVFSDQDVRFDDGMPKNVAQAFEELPNADVILFGARFLKGGKVYHINQPESKRLRIYNALKYGTYAIAIRRSSLLIYNLSFHQLFGGGCIYSHGEDSDFIIRCFTKGLKVYSHKYILCSTSKDTSTWFEGYNEKYYFDTGAIARNSFGIFAIPYMAYMIFRTRKYTSLPMNIKVEHLKAGFCNYKQMLSYEAYLEKMSVAKGKK